MTARVILLNSDAAFALARRVVMSGVYDEEAVEAALDVLACSTDDNDRATVRWLREYAPHVSAGMAQIEDTETDVRRKMVWLLASIAVVGGIFGGVAMEAAMTAAVAGVM